MTQPGTTIGNRYTIVKPLGGGGFKQVYLAEDIRLARRPCALAEMIDTLSDPKTQRDAVAAFEREAEMLVKLDNEHVPRVYDCFSEQNKHYLVMEYVPGETLEQKLAASGGKLNDVAVIQVAVQVLSTLEYLHNLHPPVIYRDLKPSNVMIEPSGRVKLIDFGIARFFQPSKTATMIGTPGYAPPEQYRGKVEQRSDIYSLGATMHHALTGRDPSTEPPFSFPPLREVCPSCDRSLAQVVDAALAYEPSRRIASASEFRQRLLGTRNEVSPTATTVPSLAGTPVQLKGSGSHRRRLYWVLLLGGILAIFMIRAFSYEPASDHESKPTRRSSAEVVPSISPVPAMTASPGALSKAPTLASPARRKSPKIHRASRGTEVTSEAPRWKAEKAEALSQYFSLGSSKAQVLALQGTPTGVIDGGIIGDIWNYGFSSVDFNSEGIVKGYSNVGRNLRVKVKPNAKSGSHVDYFSIGSTKDEVLAIQGTPTGVINGGIIGDIWNYGFSGVDFNSEGMVKGYSDVGGNLHVKVK